MPTNAHFVTVAKQLKQRLNGKAFISMPRREVTELLRDVSGEETTRIKSAMGAQLEKVLLEQGVRIYPSLEGTTTGDTVRLFHPATVVADLIDILSHPDSSTDDQLAHVISKIKGKWMWPPAA